MSKELFRHINKNAITMPKKDKDEKKQQRYTSEDEIEKKSLTTDNKSLSSSKLTRQSKIYLIYQVTILTFDNSSRK